MADEDTARGRLTAAVTGKPKMAYARVRAADVIEVGAALPKPSQTTAALVKGAEGAIAERVAAGADVSEIEVFQIAGQVQELLDAAPNPVPKGE